MKISDYKKIKDKDGKEVIGNTPINDLKKEIQERADREKKKKREELEGLKKEIEKLNSEKTTLEQDREIKKDLRADLIKVSARVKKYTEKALLLVFGSGSEIWIPPSTIHNDYDEKNKSNFQNFLIDTWIFKKRQVEKDSELAIISAKVKVFTEKALLLTFMDGSEFWIPHSTIHNDYNENEKEIFKDFLIDTWILKKKEINFRLDI